MPQLNPASWFATLVFSWLMFLTVVLPKILTHTFPYDPTLKSTKPPKKVPWTWPWH